MNKLKYLPMKKKLLIITLIVFMSGIINAQIRPYDKRGINIFEPQKKETPQFEKFKIKLGGSFTQSFQALSHSSTSTADPGLVEIVPGFNTANANLYLDTYLADGVTLNMTLYLSSRHHNETWVKGGYLQLDKLPFIKSDFLDDIMKYTTIKVGHMEINYGDAHFRRSDNGNSIYNPFVENYIMDAFTTEIGAEIYVGYKGFLAVGGITNGKIKGDISKGVEYTGASNGKSKPAFIGKLGFDKYIADNTRLRVTGSAYYTAGSISNTLYGGDRAGSHYFGVMDANLATTSFTSGRFNPGFTDKVRSFMGNVLLKHKGLEWFTTIESSKGRSKTETEERKASQFATDLVYRFGGTDNFWLGGRYNIVKSEFSGSDIQIDRFALSGGWFITKNVMTKLEYVTQKYDGFPQSDLRSGGKFNGIVLEAVIGF
jgi:hypothetical protein